MESINYDKAFIDLKKIGKAKAVTHKKVMREGEKGSAAISHGMRLSFKRDSF